MGSSYTRRPISDAQIVSLGSDVLSGGLDVERKRARRLRAQHVVEGWERGGLDVERKRTRRLREPTDI